MGCVPLGNVHSFLKEDLTVHQSLNLLDPGLFKLSCWHTLCYFLK